MRELGVFDGVAGDEFLEAYWSGLEVEADPLVLDSLRPSVPVNPHPDRLLNSFAIKCPRSLITPDGVQPPNLLMADRSEYRLWFFPGLDPAEVSAKTGKPSQYNVLLMVRHCYASLLDGEAVDELPNPFFYEGALWRRPSNSQTLGSLRKALVDAKNWRDTLPPEFLRRGGEVSSEATRRSARENLKAAHRRRSETSEARLRKVAEAHEAGRTNEDIAAALGVKVESVPTILWRAKQTTGAASSGVQRFQ